MGKSTEVITAEQARDLANTSGYTISHIYKAIQEQAHCNQVSLVWDIYTTSTVALDDVIAELQKNGYTVEVNAKKKFITISW